jgi:hypothetical protein
VAVLVGGLLPFGRSPGGVRRSAFALCLAVRAAGLDRRPAVHIALLAWFAVPGLAFGTVMAVALRLRQLAGTLAGVTAIVAIGSVAALISSPLRVDVGGGVAVVGGMAGTGAAVILLGRRNDA